jgi:hypothetical protein
LGFFPFPLFRRREKKRRIRREKGGRRRRACRRGTKLMNRRPSVTGAGDAKTGAAVPRRSVIHVRGAGAEGTPPP